MMGAAALETIWTTVFDDGPDGGNRCPVVFNAETRSTTELQAIAADFGVETVFVLPPRHDGAARLRYFVPLHEMEMCVHATIAASLLLHDAGVLSSRRSRLETALGTIDVECDIESRTAVVSQFPPTFGAVVDPAPVLSALRLSGSALAASSPLRSVSTARAKLMVPLRDEATLDTIDPDFELLWDLCDQLDVTGLYPFTLDAADADVAARQFPRRSGYPEDPATGVAAGGLAAYLAASDQGRTGWNRYRIAQGRAMGRRSMIVAEARRAPAGSIDACRVGGTARRI